MLRAVSFVHRLLADVLRPGDCAVDATAGNGHDMEFLLGKTGPEGMVYGFEIQSAGIAATRERLGGAPGWVLLERSHAEMAEALPPGRQGSVSAVVFNLGYLPGGDKGITTSTATTLTALRAGLALLRPGGVLTAVVYPGHPGGSEEASAVRTLAAQLPRPDWHCVEYAALNTAAPAPSVIAILRQPSPSAGH